MNKLSKFFSILTLIVLGLTLTQPLPTAATQLHERPLAGPVADGQPCLPYGWDAVHTAFSFLARPLVMVDSIVAYGNDAAALDALAGRFGWDGKTGTSTEYLKGKGVEVSENFPTEGQNKVKVFKNKLCPPPPSLTPQGPSSDSQAVPVTDGQQVSMAPIRVPEAQPMPLWVWIFVVALIIALGGGSLIFVWARAGEK